MLIGILSDTHDHLDRIHQGIERLRSEGVELLIHAGDIVSPFAAKALRAWEGPLHVVYGNNDGERNGLQSVLPQICDGPLLVECDGRRISVDHYPPSERHRPLTPADVIVFGHTHQFVNEMRNGILHVNPGESCGWVTGKSTVATLSTDNLACEIIPVE